MLFSLHSSDSNLYYKETIIDQGFRHLEPVKFELSVNCDGCNFTATVIDSSSGNFILQCQHPVCESLTCSAESVTGIYNASRDIFEIGFIFNLTRHGGQKYNISISCNDTSQEKQILLKPYLSGFAVNATDYNESSITIDCQHTLFHFSSSSITIKLQGGNDFGACSENGCTSGCTSLQDGLRCVVPYTTDDIYQCYLDGAVYNVDRISNQTAAHSSRNISLATGTAAKSVGVGKTQWLLFVLSPVAAFIFSAYCQR